MSAISTHEHHEVSRARGVAVVIDVLRAFTTEAYAFAGGAERVILAASADAALSLRRIVPDSLLIGEVSGLMPPGFDLGNSPVEVAAQDLSGRSLVHASSAGTVTALAAAEVCELVYVTGLVTAGATARAAARHGLPLSLVISGTHCGWDGDEDRVCAELILSTLGGPPVTRSIVERRVLDSTPGRFLSDPRHPEFVKGDLDACLSVDCFDFAMRCAPSGGGFEVRPERPG